MNIFSVIIMLIAGIGILNLLLMAVYERTREIGLLGAMGLKPRQIASSSFSKARSSAPLAWSSASSSASSSTPAWDASASTTARLPA